MIDIHSHILPNIDDGSRSLDESFTMLKMACDNGVTTQVLTPHIHLGKFNNTKPQIESAFEVFREQVNEQNIPIKLLLGAELRIGPEVMQLAAKDAIPCLGEVNGKKTFLLEFPRQDIPMGSDNLVKWLMSKNYLPIIVHPERNTTFLRNRNKLQTFIDLGCPLQLTASSLTGKFGADVQKMSEELLQEDKIAAIASDCHNLKGRGPDLQSGFDLATELIGLDKASLLVKETPTNLTTNNKFHSIC